MNNNPNVAVPPAGPIVNTQSTAAMRAVARARDFYYDRVFCCICGMYMTNEVIEAWLPDLDDGEAPAPLHPSSTPYQRKIYMAYYFLRWRRSETEWLRQAQIVGTDPWNDKPLR